MVRWDNVEEDHLGYATGTIHVFALTEPVVRLTVRLPMPEVYNGVMLAIRAEVCSCLARPRIFGI